MGDIDYTMVKRDFGQNPITDEEVIHTYWYAVIDNLIGGWAVSNVNMPTADLNPYEGRFELGCFLAEYEARHIAELHNAWWQKQVWATYAENIHADLTDDEWWD